MDQPYKKHCASLKDHLLTRILDNSLLTSHDMTYLQFAFDVFLNSDLNRNSATIACHRGLEAIVRDGEKLHADPNQSLLQFDELDSRRQVNRLVATLRTEGAWTYFITLTCNDSGTPGVAPLRKAIEDHANRNCPEQLNKLLQNYCVMLTRAWERTVHYIWQYINTSHEQILGPIKASWMRFEFQIAGALGNRPHVHAGVTLQNEPLQQTLSRIRCSNMTMWANETNTDFETLQHDALVTSHADYGKLQDHASTLQQHSCYNAGARCMKRKAKDDTLLCRVPKHPSSFLYTFQDHGTLYPEETYHNLQYLDLATPCPCGRHWHTGVEFRAGMWHYPAQPDEHFVPTVPRLFVAMKSSTNVQVCDRKFQVSYLAKYAAGMDEKRDVSLIKTKTPDELHVHVHDAINIKISGQRIHHLNQRQAPLAREIALTEMIWYSLKFPYVVSSCDNVHASTKAPEYRAAILKHHRRHPQDIEAQDGGGGLPQTVAARLPYPEWRQFTASQVQCIEAHEKGTLYLDATSAFSLRPPELLLFSKLELYLRWFTWRKDPKAHLDLIVNRSHWIDGGERCIRLRHAHVSDAANFIFTLTTDAHENIANVAIDMYVHIFRPLLTEHNNAPHSPSDHYERFVDISKTKRNVVVFNCPSPSNIPAFSVHLLLTMGSFTTELDLYSVPNMVTAFRLATILHDNEPDHDDVKRIAKDYVLNQLLWYPFGSQTFSKHLTDTLQALRAILLDETINEVMPKATETDIAQSTIDALTKHELAVREAAIDVLSTQAIPDFPPVEDFKQGEVYFHPRITSLNTQSNASVNEQKNALATCIDAINDAVPKLSKHKRCYILVGPPGCGKTHILLISNTYALSIGLRGLLVALTSERARRLGGIHIHMAFSIPVMNTAFYTIQSMASKAILALSRTPVRLAFLQRLHVLFIEEIGLVSAELFAVLDTILRAVRQCNEAMGGLVVIGTGDPHQLSPVDGRPFWVSHHMICSFTVIAMKHYVRSSTDKDLQHLIDIMRNVTITDEHLTDFVRIISNRCMANFVPTWDHVPPDVLKIVGTKAACNEIIDHYINKKRHDSHIQCQTFTADDEAETLNGIWGKATTQVQRHLDKVCLEKKTLVLFVGQTVRLTYNNSHATPHTPRFSQGQLCIVTQLPDIHSHKLCLKLIPPGERNFDPTNMPDLPGWELFALVPTPSPLVIVGGIGHVKARRIQYRVTYYVSSTVHKALGETCYSIATQISTQQRKYRLWEREQLLVLISRVPSLDNIMFVTEDPNDTLMAIKKLVHQIPPWMKHIQNVLTALDVTSNISTITHYDNPQPPPTDVSHLPTSNLGFVYMLVSTTNRNFAYVGETANVHRRLLQHNSSHGSQFTNNPHLRPWTCFIFVHRFPGTGNEQCNITARKRFESQWHDLNGQDNFPNTRTIHNNGQVVFNRFKQQHPELIWEQLGEIQ
jgi:hypothetical protein